MAPILVLSQAVSVRHLNITGEDPDPRTVVVRHGKFEAMLKATMGEIVFDATRAKNFTRDGYGRVSFADLSGSVFVVRREKPSGDTRQCSIFILDTEKQGRQPLYEVFLEDGELKIVKDPAPLEPDADDTASVA